MSELGDKLKELRGSQSQREMADPLGIKYQQWAKYERGEVSPGADMLKQICLVHACSADWLLGLPRSTAPSTSIYDSPGAIVASPGAKVNGHGAVVNSPGAVVHPLGAVPADCANCKFKRLAEALKAVQAG